MQKENNKVSGEYTKAPMTLIELLTVIGVFGLVLTWVVRHFYSA